jgi:hypothetical protein
MSASPYRAVAIIFSIVLLVSCGGGGGGQSSVPTAATPPAATPPVSQSPIDASLGTLLQRPVIPPRTAWSFSRVVP